MCVLIVSTAFVWNISHSEENSTTCYTNLHICSCKVLAILVRCYWKFNFLHRIPKNLPTSEFMTIRLVGAELFSCGRPIQRQTDGRTDGRTDGKTDGRRYKEKDRHSEDNYYVSQFCERAWCWHTVPPTTSFKVKGKAVPLQAWRGPEGSRRMRFLDFKTTSHEGGKFVSPTHRPPLPPGIIPGIHFY